MKNRMLALAQLVSAPLLLLIFMVAEPWLMPEWPRYVGYCLRSLVDGRRR